MQKLKLDLSELNVQSFPTTDGADGREGTVHGMIVETDQADCSAQLTISVAVNLGLDPAFGGVGGLGLDPAGALPEAFGPGRIQGFQGDVA